MTSLTQKQGLILRWLKRCVVPATPRLVSAQSYVREGDICASRVRLILQALERKGLAEIVPQDDGVERWRAVG